ncbi:MAG: ThuA domain-containing protein [Erythrobacter sp.]|nr:MAG: ThuA domain-containing protein [Erythrobacter sp.]
MTRRFGWKRVLLIFVLLALAVFAVGLPRTADASSRPLLQEAQDHDTEAPVLPDELPRPAILVFSKTNAYRHVDAIPAANALFERLAADNGWGYFHTENGAAFSPEILSQFDAVVFNNVSGDVFTPDQRAAFQSFLESGGGYVGVHAAGDNSHEAWSWYMTDIIGTTFTGHPMDPQFQQATVRIEDRMHPATDHLEAEWVRTDEWYSFDRSPRDVPGVSALATLDESTYDPGSFFGTELAMGADHPIIWWRCAGSGRVLYSALGHTPQSFAEPEYVTLLQDALRWSMKLEGEACGTAPVVAEAAAEEAAQ